MSKPMKQRRVTVVIKCKEVTEYSAKVSIPVDDDGTFSIDDVIDKIKGPDGDGWLTKIEDTYGMKWYRAKRLLIDKDVLTLEGISVVE